MSYDSFSVCEARVQQGVPRYYGLAEVAAYTAYNNSPDAAIHLDLAKQTFDTVYADFINSSAAQSGHYPRKLNTTCARSESYFTYAYSSRVLITRSGAGWLILQCTSFLPHLTRCNARSNIRGCGRCTAMPPMFRSLLAEWGMFYGSSSLLLSDAHRHRRTWIV